MKPVVVPHCGSLGATAILLVAGLLCLPPEGAHAALVGLYTFDDPGNLGLDSSGQGNDLVSFGGSVSYIQSGQDGGGLGLGGTGGLSTADGHAPSAFPVGSAAYTIAVSFRTDSTFNLTHAALGLIGWGDYGQPGETNALRLLTSNESGYPGVRDYWWLNDINASYTVNDGAWHSIIATYNGTTRSLYVDGSLLATDLPGAPSVTDANFAIGRTCPSCNGGEFFVGTLDNVAVFDTALSPLSVSLALNDEIDVPEPASTAGLAVGLVGLLACRRKRQANPGSVEATAP